MSNLTIVQYLFAALAIIALVVLNIWGNPDVTLNGGLLAVVSTTVWGGLQREKGIKIGAKSDG